MSKSTKLSLFFLLAMDALFAVLMFHNTLDVQEQRTEYERLKEWVKMQEAQNQTQDHLIDQLIYDVADLGGYDKR